MAKTNNNKIKALAAALKNLVTTHESKKGSSQEAGHVQAGGAPQEIGDNINAGTDNGYYARADHVHTVDYNKVKNKPTGLSYDDTTGILRITYD